jgi:hypothetical protein
MNSVWIKLPTHVLVALILLASSSVHSATCAWNAPSGNWSAIANWSGCSDVAGPSTRTPGVTDIALISTGAASFNVNATVAEFEIGTGASLTLTGGAERTLSVNTALRLNGGTLSTTNNVSFPFFRVILQAGGNGQILATSTLSNTVELENRGLLQLASATGTALNILDLSRVINTSGATFALSGGNARLHLDGMVPFTVQAGATLSTNGNVFIGENIDTPGTPRIESFGTIAHVGPGMLTIKSNSTGGGAAVLQAEGQLSISNGTLLCDGVVDNCRHQNGSDGSANLTILLANGTYSRGGPTGLFFGLPMGSKLIGNGVINGALVNFSGTLAPGAESGPPYGNLSITGAAPVGNAEFHLDLGGSAPGSFDTLSFGGSTRFSASVDTKLRLQLAPGFAPTLNTLFPVLTYASVVVEQDAPIINLVESNSAMDWATRFMPTVLEVFPAPRITIDDASLIEGNAGTAIMTFAVRLSQPTAQTVTVKVVKNSFGTATDGPPPGGDYLAPGAGQTVTFAPGEILKSATAQISGDLAVEADEAFAFNILRHDVQNAAFGNGVHGALGAAGTIISDDLPVGTRFVLIGKDNASTHIRRYTNTGSYLDTWDTQQGGGIGLPNTGQCFAPNGNVLATRFGYTSPILFSRHGAVRNLAFGNAPGVYFNRHESCVFDRAGNVYVGQAGFNDVQTDAQVPVLKFSPSGVPLDSFVLPTGPRGTDWIDLASDQCTLYYTSEDTTVRRYNLCTRTPLPALITTLTAPFCYALRLRPNRELMVACQDAVHRVSAQGVNLQTYTRQSIGETNAVGLFAMNLDPDGTSFWTAGGISGNVYRVDIASGAVLTTFNSGPGGVSGLSVYDELFDTSSDVLFAHGFETVTSLSAQPAWVYPPRIECSESVMRSGYAMPHYWSPDWIAEFSAPACAD